MSYYKVFVQTGTIDYGGTDANVFITLLGKGGDSGERHLAASDGAFEKGNTDVFSISSSELGDLEWVRIRHDNSHDDAGWFLEQIVIEHNGSHALWVFPCHQWLAVDEGDHRIDRMLHVATNGGLAHRSGIAMLSAAQSVHAVQIA